MLESDPTWRKTYPATLYAFCGPSVIYETISTCITEFMNLINDFVRVQNAAKGLSKSKVLAALGFNLRVSYCSGRASLPSCCCNFLSLLLALSLFFVNRLTLEAAPV